MLLLTDPMPKTRTLRLARPGRHAAPGLAPQTPFWVIGDVHGRADQLAPLLDRIMPTGEAVVLLGDYINKGPDSAAALRLIHQASLSGQVTALRGNHEELLARFLMRPRLLLRTWLAYGGQTTLDSFGIAALPDTPTPKQVTALRDALHAAMGPLADWVQSLPYRYDNGNVTALHAGADPATPLALQPAPSFVWGHPQFTKAARPDGRWIVHGHHPVTEITVKERRIAINTLAGEGGIISALRISPEALDLRP